MKKHTTPTCHFCQAPRAKGNNSYCRAHANEYMRGWRKSRTLSPIARAKMNARSYAHVYLKRGKPYLKCFATGHERPAKPEDVGKFSGH